MPPCLIGMEACVGAFAEAVDQLAADFIAALCAPEARAWRRLTVQLWAESLHDRRLAVAVRDGVETPKAILVRMVQRAKTRGELPTTLDAHATARLLIAHLRFESEVFPIAAGGGGHLHDNARKSSIGGILPLSDLYARQSGAAAIFRLGAEQQQSRIAPGVPQFSQPAIISLRSGLT